MTQSEREMRALLVKIRQELLDSTPNTPDNLPDYTKPPYKLIREISNVLMIGATQSSIDVQFPCKTCRHFHRGKAGDDIKVGQHVIKTIIDHGCFEEGCFCGKITPSEMFT